MSKLQQKLILTLRIALGLLFLYAGIDKILNNFSATGYLLNVTQGPFASLFEAFANNSIIDYLVMVGEILIGISLITGTFIKFTAVMGVLMMAGYYLSVLPPETGPVNNQMIYAICFILLGVFNAGKYWGMDSIISNKNIKKYLSQFKQK